MLGGVFVLRGIAAAHVAVGHAQAQMHPAITEIQAFLAAGGVRADVANRIEMGALRDHAVSPWQLTAS
jgi:hypothetical protein